MIFIDDADGLCIHVGSEWPTLTGQPVAEALGHGWRERVHPDDRATVAGVLDEARAIVARFSLRFRLLKPGGGSRWVGSAGVPSIGPPGHSFLGYLGSLTELADGATDALEAYGTVGRLVPPPLHPGTDPGDRLDLIADHLIIAKHLLDADGASDALPAVAEALFHVGRALSRRSSRRRPLN